MNPSENTSNNTQAADPQKQQYQKLLHLLAIPFWVILLYIGQQMIDRGSANDRSAAETFWGFGLPSSIAFYASLAALALVQFLVLLFRQRSRSINSPRTLLLCALISGLALPLELIVVAVSLFFGPLPVIAACIMIVFHLVAYIRLAK